METVNINGKDYQISFIDTEGTVKNLVAFAENTPVDYVKITKFRPEENKIKIHLLKEDLKIPAEALFGSVDDSDTLLKQLSKEWDLPETTILLEWLQINKDGEINEWDLVNNKEFLTKKFAEIDSIQFWSMDSINKRSEDYQKEQKKKLYELERIVGAEHKYRDQYSKYKSVETTSFIQDSVITEYQITIDYDPLEAFDNIVLDKNVPFVHLFYEGQSYYKLINNFIPSKEWLSSENTLTFKISQETDDESEEWRTITLDYTGQTAPYTALLTIESSNAVGQNSEETIKNNILSVLTKADIQIKKRTEKGIKGIFAVPEMNLSREVFLDLITNNPFVSYFFYVDEKVTLSTLKSTLYLFFSPGAGTTEVLTVYLSQRTAGRKDTFYVNKKLPLFTPYLNVRVSRANNLGQIKRFQKAFGSMLAMYKDNFNTIVAEYNALIPGFKSLHTLQKTKTTVSTKLKALQKTDPELFVHDYPTKCEQKKQPKPIKKSEKKKYEKQGYQVLNYPKKSNNFYICDDNTYKYPGLQNNQIIGTDKEKYPYLPCCYSENQLIKKGSKLKTYLDEKPKQIKAVGDEPCKRIANIVTKKIVTRGKLGYLPRNIHYVLTKDIKKTKHNYQYYRQGVQVGNNSFIETILLALDHDYIKYNDVQKTEYINDLRANLLSKKISAVIQELYDTDYEKIIKDILNPDVVFDSEIFTGLLEVLYNCQIFVFVRNPNNPNGAYEIPRYTQGYLYKKLDPTKPTVLVYKHYGSYADGLENPHYELIVRCKTDGTTWWFKDTDTDPSSPVNNVYSYFLQTYKLYSIGIGRYRAIEIPPEALHDAIGQVIDRYGKSRGYIFKNNIFMATSPLAPADDIEIMDIPDSRPSWKVVRKFIKERNLTVQAQDVANGNTIGVSITFPNIPYSYIPIEPTSVITGIKTDKHLGYSIPTNDDIIDETLRNRKIADYLMQLTLYSFSIWYREQKKNKLSGNMSFGERKLKEKALLLDSVDKFLREQLVIDEDHEYDLSTLPRKLTINSDFFEDDKLIINSDKIFTKLGYYLRFMISKDNRIAENYADKIYLSNFYTYTNDFKQHKSQMIFVGSLSINNWIDIQTTGISNQSHRVPHSDLKEPYFFSHWALNGGKPVIIQNVSGGNFNRALAVAANYIKNNINLGYNAQPIKNIDHTTYFFEDGILMRDGNNPVTLWRFGENYYAAMIIP